MHLSSFYNRIWIRCKPKQLNLRLSNNYFNEEQRSTDLIKKVCRLLEPRTARFASQVESTGS